MVGRKGFGRKNAAFRAQTASRFVKRVRELRLRVADCIVGVGKKVNPNNSPENLVHVGSPAAENNMVERGLLAPWRPDV